MRYFGGKARISNDIAKYINYIIKPNQTYWEPFCGGCWIISKINGNRKKFASDLHPSLIRMWIALQNGWIPPTNISEEDYNRIKIGEDCALKAFVGFGCSYAGKYFGGYARCKTNRNYAKNAYNSLFAKMRFLNNVEFINCDYREFNPPNNSLIYCDPPYNDTTNYSLGNFDYKSFWNWAKSQAKKGHTILISEYKAPSDFVCVWSKETHTDIRNSNGIKEKRIEKIFQIKSV